ncbi:MAG: hypothetical protein L0Y44_03125 [Phycisphaerales bacterium]|nr:hypothetical protein [Phycisphaerales bacterium]
MEFVSDFSKTWADPQMRHALVVHWPVVLTWISVLVALALALSGGKNLTLKVTLLAVCVAMTIAGWMGLNSGERAERSVQGSLSAAAEEVLEEHEELGEKVPLLAAVCTGLVAVSFLKWPPARITAAWLAVIGCGITAGWVANTAHHGGQLVYEHGVGTPDVSAPVADSGQDRATPPEASPESPPETQPADSEQPDIVAANDPSMQFFQNEVRPILVDHCLGCHNPQRARRSGRFDQTSLAKILEGGRSGPAVVAGKPEESLLIKRVRGLMPDEDQMPPPPDPPLTAEQIAKLEQWIRELRATNDESPVTSANNAIASPAGQ